MINAVSQPITNSEDIFDSREVIERIDYLADIERDDDEEAEYAALQALTAEAEGYAPDWRYGVSLIRDSYFKTYARELAEDIGAIQADATWPACHIDWEAATHALKQDYTSVDFDGVTYWVR